MMNMGRWDEAREHLLRARKLAPKADYVVYAMAALDCLTGEAESAMENLKVAIQLRPENRYHARNDEDFAFLQEDPRFTELLYPDREARAVNRRSSVGIFIPLRQLSPCARRCHRRRHGPFHAAARPEAIRRTAGRIDASRYPIADLAAVVTVTDDGGSSGRLRREYSILPPGDIRNCMVALSQDEALLGRLFQYRFHAGRGLAAGTASAICSSPR